MVMILINFKGRSIVGLSHAAAGYACGYHFQVKYFYKKKQTYLLEVATTLPAQKIINEVNDFGIHTL